MTTKKDSILAYIGSLPGGTKVSVRNLSKQFQVSEGTAYQAIRAATTLGLVQARPKSGTVRIDRTSDPQRAPLLSELAAQIGLTVEGGAIPEGAEVHRIAVLDGSEDEILHMFDTCEEPPPLCVVGNRRDAQMLAVRHGASIVVTGKTSISDEIRIAAQYHKVAALHTFMDTSSFLNIVYSRFRPPAAFSSSVSNWMNMPQYLFLDDVVESWHQFPVSMPTKLLQYPVVDSDLHVRGFVDLRDVLAAPLSQKISTLVRETAAPIILSEDTDMLEASGKMLASGAALALVTDGDRLVGILGLNDVVRYHNFCDTTGRHPGYHPALGNFNPDGKHFNYTFIMPESLADAQAPDRLSFFFSLLFSAACAHVEHTMGTPAALESINFYTLVPFENETELTISSMLLSSDERACVLDVELFSNNTCHAKWSMRFRVDSRS